MAKWESPEECLSSTVPELRGRSEKDDARSGVSKTRRVRSPSG